MSQTLYDLPEGWEWVKLGSICDFVRGPFGGSLKKEIFKSSGFAVYEQQHAIYNQFDDIRYFIDTDKFEAMKRFVLQPDDIIMSCSGTMGKTAIVPKGIKEGIINQALLKLTTHERLYNRFLQFWMDSYHFQSDLNDNAQGAAIKNVASVSVLKEVYFPLPPLAEQTRIVEKLDAVLSRIDTAIDELQQSFALVDAMFKSGLDQSFNPLGSPSNEDGLYDLPEGWGWKQLHTIADVVSGYAFKSEDFSSDIGVPSVKITNVGLGAFIESQDDYLPSDFSIKYNKFAVKQGDIVIALTRPVINGGLKVCRVPKNYNGALVNQRVAAVVYNHEAILEYVYWFLLSPMTLEYVVEKSKSLNQPNLSIKDLSKLEVPLPNISEQQKVVEALDALNEQTTQLKTEITAKIGMFNQLKASVLDGAFRGRCDE